MSLALRTCVVLLIASTAASTADPEPQEEFRQVRARVLDDVNYVPRYTCVQTVNRAQFRPQYGVRPAGCRSLIAARKQFTSPGYLIVRDRLRLDVAVVDGEETFSWAGARQFETSHVDDLVKSGATGSGEFISYLNSVFGSDTDSISYLGNWLFGFNVPLAKSHYTYSTRGPDRTIGYHGSFLVEPATAELKRLTVVADEFPPGDDVCQVEDNMDYHRVKIGNGDFSLPESATMDVLFADGIESVNEIGYSDCHEYAGEATIRFGDEAGAGTSPEKSSPDQSSLKKEAAEPPASARPLPAGIRFRIGLTSPIHSATAAAGDAITGTILREVKDRKLGVVAHENDVVHGRILQLELHMNPIPRWLLAIRFDTLEHDGMERPLALKSRERDGTFVFVQAGNIVIDQSFHSDWETR